MSQYIAKVLLVCLGLFVSSLIIFNEVSLKSVSEQSMQILIEEEIKTP